MELRAKEKLAEYFGPEALEPLEVHVQNWDNEPYIRGGPIGNFPPGTLSQVGKLTNPEDHIYWAGTELAYESQGFMDGAIESGVRASTQLLKDMGKHPSSPD